MGSYRDQREARKEHLASIGLSRGDLERWRYKWNNLLCSARQRGYGCSLSFEDYTRIAVESGVRKPDMIGQTTDKYQLARYGDVGDYEVGNCRFIPMLDNLRERALNGGDVSISRKLKGRTVSNDSSVKSRVEKRSKRFKITSPDGVVYEGINLQEFCREHGLKQGCMANVCRGEVKYHKGWTGEYVNGL